MTSSKICYCDLDGVFTNYPRCWLDYIRKVTTMDFSTLEAAKQYIDPKEYAELKKRYRASDYKYNIKPVEDSAEFTKKLWEKGWFIIVATTRPMYWERTAEWLYKNNIMFDKLMFVLNKLEVVRLHPFLAFGLDDDYYTCALLADIGYKMFWMRNGQSENGQHPNVIPVEGFMEVI